MNGSYGGETACSFNTHASIWVTGYPVTHLTEKTHGSYTVFRVSIVCLLYMYMIKSVQPKPAQFLECKSFHSKWLLYQKWYRLRKTITIFNTPVSDCEMISVLPAIFRGNQSQVSYVWDHLGEEPVCYWYNHIPLKTPLCMSHSRDTVTSVSAAQPQYHIVQMRLLGLHVLLRWSLQGIVLGPTDPSAHIKDESLREETHTEYGQMKAE